jgi:hypothetical protein
VITVATVMARLALKVRLWRFSRALVRAEKQRLSIGTIAKPVGTSARLGLMAQLGRLNNSKPTHKDWMK